MEKWMVYNKKADFQKIGSEFGIDPVIARLIRNRGAGVLCPSYQVNLSNT